MTTLEEMLGKVKDAVRIENVYENLPLILVGAAALYFVDKSLNVADKMKPMTKWVKSMNENQWFELIDTIGDNIQLVNSTLKTLKIDLTEVQLGKLADFLQNLGTSGKYISKLVSLVKEKTSFGSNQSLTDNSSRRI